MFEVDVSAISPARFRSVLPAARYEAFERAMEEGRRNALQRHAAVIVQKSLAEGFGLTVAEAMWKSRPRGRLTDWRDFSSGTADRSPCS